MDELEISGKRYISTRRAAREHGYHSDYMGQLIRGKKVAGQKVGRAWYIEEESLAVYLGKTLAPAPTVKVAPAEAPAPAPIERLIIEEPAPLMPEPAPAPVVAAPEPVQHVAEIIKEEQPIAKHFEQQIIAEPVAAYAAPQAVAEPVVTRQFVQEIHHAPIHTEEERRIPIHTPAPAPAMQSMGGLRYAEDATPSMPIVTRAPHVQTPSPAPYNYAPAKESTGTFPFVSLSIVGVMAILAAAFASNFVTATVVTEQGKAATVQYAIHW